MGCHRSPPPHRDFHKILLRASVQSYTIVTGLERKLALMSLICLLMWKGTLQTASPPCSSPPQPSTSRHHAGLGRRVAAM
jgi:hypothetical protein